MRVGRTDKLWRSFKLPFPNTLNTLSTQRMDQSYCRSFHISHLITGAVLYRGVVGEQCSLEVFPGLTNSLWCCSAVLALNSGFLGHMRKRQSQPHLKLDTPLEPLIHKELENTGNMCLTVLKVHWKNYGWLFFSCLVGFFKALLYVCKGLRPKYCTEHLNFILKQ